MKPKKPTPVKFFIGLLFSDLFDISKPLGAIFKLFGKPDFISEEFEFIYTSYYKNEFGDRLFRKFVSFEKLINPGELADIKISTNAIEDRFLVNKNRFINIDPGYMDYHKVILASCKYNSQKIYLNKGVYADPVLCFSKGNFIPTDQSFPDFKDGGYTDLFLEIRGLYKPIKTE